MSISRLACALVLLLATPAAALPPPEVGCERCVVVDEDGNVLWARNRRDRYPNASTTKMVTALLVAEEARPDEVVTVSSTAAAVGGGGLDLTAGETYTVDALLYALLLDSSNEAAMALAEHVSGSVDRFVEEMNGYAIAIGASRTHFANPHGLDAEGHYSSAGDLAWIGARVLENEYLAKIVATAETTIATPGGSVRLENRNLLLESYHGAIGIKTGRTLGAGNVLVAAARRGGRTVIAVAMNSYDSFADSAALLDYGFAELRRLARIGTLVEDGDAVGELVFDTGTVDVVAGSSLEGIVPRTASAIDVEVVASRDLELPIAAGDVIGKVRVSTGRGVVGSVPAVASGAIEDVDDGDPWWAAPVVGLVSLFGGVVA